MKKGLFIVLASATFVMSCSATKLFNNTREDDKPYYLVSFDSQGGSFVSSQKIIKNEKASKPVDPTRDEFAFSGWYTDSSCTTQFNFDGESITSDKVLYAGWSADTWDFTFKGTNCGIKKKTDYTEKVKKGAKDVSYSIVADPGYCLTEYTSEDYSISLNKNKNIGTLTIPERNDNLEVKVGASLLDTVTITFEGTNCSVDGVKDDVILEALKTDSCDYKFYIKPDTNYSIPDKVDVSPSTEGITYKDGVIEITKLTQSVIISATSEITGGHRVIGFSDGASFVVGEGTESLKYYDGVIGDEQELKITYDDTDMSPITKDSVIVKENGKDKYFDFNSSSKIIAIPSVKGDITFHLFNQDPSTKTVKVSFDNDIGKNYDIYYHNSPIYFSDDKYEFSITVPKDEEEKYKNYQLFDFRPKAATPKLITKLNVTSSVSNGNVVKSYTLLGDDDSLLIAPVNDDIRISFTSTSVKYRAMEYMPFDLISHLVDSGLAKEAFYIGETKNVTLLEDNESQDFQHKIRIIGFDHDDLSDGSGKASLTLEFADILTHNDGSPYESSWIKDEHSSSDYYRTSKYRKQLNETCESILPTDMKYAIKAVRKKVTETTHGTFPETKYYDLDDKYWSISFRESGTGQSGFESKNDGFIYEFYQNSTSIAQDRIKRDISVSADDPASIQDYVTRSEGIYSTSSKTDTYQIYYINTSGKYGHSEQHSDADRNFAMSPCFCI